MSEGPRGRPEVPGTRDRFRGPALDQLCRGTRARARSPTGSTSFPGRLWPWSNVPRCRLGVPGDSAPKLRARVVVQLCPRPRGVDQISRAFPAHVPGPVSSTSCPGPLALGFKVLRGRPAVPGHSGLGLWAHEFDRLFRGNCARFRWPAVSTSSPGRLGPEPEGTQCRPPLPCDSAPGLLTRGVDQLSRVTRAQM